MRAVVITGAGSGIGHACTLALSAAGFRVFAATHHPAGTETWNGGRVELITPLVLDVTDPESIRQAVETVRAGLGEADLAALINSAGVALGGPLEFLPAQAVARQLEVNVVGQLAVTQAFLPLIRRGRGRIITIGSLSGRQALPFIGPYAASKFALRALTDSLRVELRPWAIPVILIEPGTIATGIWAKAASEAERQFAASPPEAGQLYGRAFSLLKARGVELGETGVPVERVAETVLLALTVQHPKARYVIAPAARLWMIRLLGLLPTAVRDRLVTRALR